MSDLAGPVLDDWEVLTSFLPPGWEAQAQALGALRRCRKIPDAATLLRVLLIHLADGCSLRETVVLCRQGGLAELSDVALMKRLLASAEWLRWLSVGVMQHWLRAPDLPVPGRAGRVLLVDGSMIKEPGPTGSSWRLHFALALADLRCVEAHVTDCRTGESLRHFTLQQGDLVMADRGYGRARDVRHVVDQQADVIVRVYHGNVRLTARNGRPFALLRHLHTLRPRQLGDWDVLLVGADGWSHPVRICAVKMSKTAATAARQRLIRKGQKGGYEASDDAQEASGYITVLTTLSRAAASPTQVLAMYRGRWQVELAFKHMKSIMALGHLHKTAPESIKAWIHGKLLVAFLVEALIHAGEAFFPWGYALPSPAASQSLPLA